MKNFITFLPFFFFSAGLPSQGLVLNEFSNGGSGVQEYMELVATGLVCNTIDIRNWIIDDNNGDFSGGPSSGEGIASGHIRFSNDLQWSQVPVGSIILIYNSSDRNPSIVFSDDESDSNQDSLYVLPSNSPFLEYCTATPNSGSDSYSGCTYSSPSSWSSIGLRNTGDAAQVRTNTSQYFHGLSYGASPMTGGPDGLKLSNAGGGGKVGFFDNSSSNDFRNIGNFTFGNAPGDESPGYHNSPENLAWIRSLRGSCLLPIQDRLWSEVYFRHDVLFMVCEFSTDSPLDLSFEYSSTGDDFSLIDRLTTYPSEHRLEIELPYLPGYNFYRVRWVNEYGAVEYSPVHFYEILSDQESGFKIYDLQGRTQSGSLSSIKSGTYVIRYKSYSRKIVKF